ncbi:MAG: signal peptidase II [Deltaproteobacteria bacterium]
MTRGPSRWALLAAIFAVMVAGDQVTKFLAVDRLTFAFQRLGASTLDAKVKAFYGTSHLESVARPPHVVWDPMWRMTYAENPGAAWGMLRDLPAGFRHGFFVVMTLGALGFILWYFRRLREDQRYMQVALAFIFSGAVGNLIDRLARSYVIDFVQWHWWHRPDIYWPIFNLADSLIVVGVAMILLAPNEQRAGSGKSGAAPEVQA